MTDGQFKKRGVDYDVPTYMPTLPREYYQSEDIYAEEVGKIFWRRWLMACREEEIPNVGDYYEYKIGAQSIVIVSQFR